MTAVVSLPPAKHVTGRPHDAACLATHGVAPVEVTHARARPANCIHPLAGFFRLFAAEYVRPVPVVKAEGGCLLRNTRVVEVIPGGR